MCYVRTLLKAIHHDKHDREGRWKPLKISECNSDDCLEEERITSTLVDFLFKNVKPVIDSESCQPIEEPNFTEIFKLFSETDHIVQDSTLHTDEKADLLSSPCRDAIEKFVNGYARFCHIRSEIFVFALILLKRFLRASRWTLRSTTWRPLLLVSVRLAQKIEEEEYRFSVQAMHKVYPLFSAEEFIRMECDFLSVIEFRTFVSLKRFAGEIQSIYEHTKH